jgi:uncharacterized protein (DUF427 family)
VAAMTRFEPCHKRIRAVLDDEVVVDTTDALYVWERPNYPQYYIPRGDVAGDIASMDGVRTHDEFPDHVRFDWRAMDAWYEEDEEVFVHPRDPYKRVDILPTSRAVRVEIEGTVVAESTRASFLFETGLGRRTYIPIDDVHMALFEPTESSSMCPYKGTARYWSVKINDVVHEDVAWAYDAPLRESAPIAGLVAFYDERVEVFVDGVKQ